MSLIQEEHREELQKYISGIISNKKQKLLAIFCMPDHVHILVSVNGDTKLADLVRDIKANSSRFINEQLWVKGKFEWQEGYGAFSYAKSQLDNVIHYILNQPARHREKAFKEEYIGLLNEFDIQYNDRYLFDFIE